MRRGKVRVTVIVIAVVFVALVSIIASGIAVVNLGDGATWNRSEEVNAPLTLNPLPSYMLQPPSEDALPLYPPYPSHRPLEDEILIIEDVFQTRLSVMIISIKQTTFTNTSLKKT